MKSKFALPIFLLFCLNAFTQEPIHVDFGKIIRKNLKSGAGSANVCWLVDSDQKRPNAAKSMKEALKELGTGSLRFPYGHLADNYLWNTPPFDDTNRGLLPKVASMSRPPGEWDWAVKEDGSFTSAMDFDEYMKLCQALDIKPLVVVNVFSFTYEGGPTFETLKKTAIEWVKYAKKKKYKVAYWQIGNEVDHHKDWLTMEEYIDFYQEVVSAMKEADPSIKTGPGILSDVAYYTNLVSRYPELIDFSSCHQYAWDYIETCSDYNKWKEHQGNYIPKVRKMQEAVSNSAKPDLDIVITETGVTPSNKGMGSVNNTYKALWYFEMLMNELTQPNVAYSYFWGTHSPWGGLEDRENNDLGVLFRMDDNSRKPIAEAVMLVNNHILDHMVQTTQVQGYIRTFATVVNDRSKFNIFMMNRNDKTQKVTVSLKNLPESIQTLNRTEFKGTSPDSKKITIEDLKPVAISQDNVILTLPPLSITVLKN